MATKIKLTRIGKMRDPHYRVVVADARTKRDGRSIETIGEYHPKNDPSIMVIKAERAAYWLGVGAQPTEAVTAILKVTGDWQKFKGLPEPPPMLMAAPKPDKRTLFDAALKDSGEEPLGEATTLRKKAPAKEADAGAEPAKAVAVPAEAVAEPAKAAEPAAKAAVAAGDSPAAASAPAADAPEATVEGA